jgi:hypothetical protein
VRAAIGPNIATIGATAGTFVGQLKVLAPMLLQRAALLLTGSHVPAVAKLVIGESRNFPTNA